METVNYRAMLNAKSLSIADKQLIAKCYNDTFNKELNVNTKCRDCYNDALIELISFDKKENQLRHGCVVEYKGIYYNSHSEELPTEVIELYKDKMKKNEMF